MGNLSLTFDFTETYGSIDPMYKLSLAGLTILAVTLLFNYRSSKIPIINKRKCYERGTKKAVNRLNTNATSLIKSGFEKVVKSLDRRSGNRADR
jgi:hypothetical protein